MRIKYLFIASIFFNLVACQNQQGVDFSSQTISFENSVKKINLEHRAPWENQNTSIVIDAYQENSIDWKKMATDHRVAAVIHRASSGLTKDDAYATRKTIAQQRGYLWGAYHLGKAGDPIQQAQFFLGIIGHDSETLMILDLEDLESSSMMSAPSATAFVEYIYMQTGRYPVIYANHKVTKALNSFTGNSVLKQTRLWYARFRNSIPDFPSGLWPTFFLWQFSSEINCSRTGHCLYNVPGTQFDMDVSVFYGTKAELTSQWY